MELALGQTQGQNITPQMIQSSAVLQMGIQELREYINQALLENPLLELNSPPMEPASEPSRQEPELIWLESSDGQNLHYHRQDLEDNARDPLLNLPHGAQGEEELSRYVLSQFIGTALEPEIMEAVRFLVGRLDSQGWLTEDLSELSAGSGLPRSVMERALIELQAADPAGVGAHDLGECLRLQIERRAGDHRLAQEIAEHHLPEVAKGHYHQLSRHFGVPEQTVRQACAFIRTLNPHPASGFASQDRLAYLIPDVEIFQTDGCWEAAANDRLLPTLTMNEEYLQMLEHSEDKAVKNYLSERLQQAHLLIQSVCQRHDCLEQLVTYLTRQQVEFFCLGPGHLAPLTMEQAAQALGLHVSTVSRTAKDKYFRCKWGVYPINYLFSRALGGMPVSTERAKLLLKRLIHEETKPLSDQALSEALAKEGFSLSRRTVAKYREEMGIPPAGVRRGTIC